MSNVKRFTAQLFIREKGTRNLIRLKSKEFSERAAARLENLFIKEMVSAAGDRVKEEQQS